MIKTYWSDLEGECEQCGETGTVFYDSNGDLLCEDCLFTNSVKPPLQRLSISERDKRWRELLGEFKKQYEAGTLGCCKHGFCDWCPQGCFAGNKR